MIQDYSEYLSKKISVNIFLSSPSNIPIAIKNILDMHRIEWYEIKSENGIIYVILSKLSRAIIENEISKLLPIDVNFIYS